jgi:uncharacterized protein (DUF305 family)
MVFRPVHKKQHMKKTFLFASSFFLLLACNQSGEQAANNNISDTGTHSAHNSTDTPAGANGAGGSGNLSGQSMMSLMEKNMDEMKNVESLGSNDKDFASMMKIHHMGAMEMARLQLTQGADQQVKEMAQKMLTEQQKEISELDAFLANNNQPNSAATNKKSPFYDGVIKEMDELKMDTNNHTGTMDQQFVQMMIPHHQGAIAMANHYLKTGAQDQKLKTMANSIKTDQQKEIQQMQAWLAANRK